MGMGEINETLAAQDDLLKEISEQIKRLTNGNTSSAEGGGAGSGGATHFQIPDGGTVIFVNGGTMYTLSQGAPGAGGQPGSNDLASVMESVAKIHTENGDRIERLLKQHHEQIESLMAANRKALEDQSKKVDELHAAEVKKKDDEIAELKAKRTVDDAAVAAEKEKQKKWAEQRLKIAHEAVKKLEEPSRWKSWGKAAVLIGAGLAAGAVASTGLGLIGLSGLLATGGAGAVAGAVRGMFKYSSEAEEHKTREALKGEIAAARAAGVEFTDDNIAEYARYSMYDKEAPSMWKTVSKNAVFGAGIAMGGSVAGAYGAYLLGYDDLPWDALSEDVDTFLNGPVPSVPSFDSAMDLYAYHIVDAHTLISPSGDMLYMHGGEVFPVPHGFEGLFAGDGMFGIGDPTAPFTNIYDFDPMVKSGLSFDNAFGEVLGQHDLYWNLDSYELYEMHTALNSLIDPASSDYLGDSALKEMGIKGLDSSGHLIGIDGSAIDLSPLLSKPEALEHIVDHVRGVLGPESSSKVIQLFHDLHMNTVVSGH